MLKLLFPLKLLILVKVLSLIKKKIIVTKVKVVQSCPTLCDPMDYSPWILQARILEWVAFPFSRGLFPTQGWNPGLPHCGCIFTS